MRRKELDGELLKEARRLDLGGSARPTPLTAELLRAAAYELSKARIVVDTPNQRDTMVEVHLLGEIHLFRAVEYSVLPEILEEPKRGYKWKGRGR